MIVCDVNLLLYAYDTRSEFHKEAAKWWEGVLGGKESVGLPWSVIHGFLRTMTNRKVFEIPFTCDEVFEIVESWLELPHVTIIVAGAKHLITMQQILRESNSCHRMLTDAHIAALAIEYRAIIHTHDRDFRRFSGVRLHDTLTE